MQNFAYQAACPWPRPQPQIDWVDSVIVMEEWLDQHIGPHGEYWVWNFDENQTKSEARIAFSKAKYRTLFLLQWA